MKTIKESNYFGFLNEIKSRIVSARIQAAKSINKELLIASNLESSKSLEEFGNQMNVLNERISQIIEIYELAIEKTKILVNKGKLLMKKLFRFILKFKKVSENPRTSNETITLLNAFEEYFEKGGFPLVIKNNDLELSKQYFEDILNKDIIRRYNIKKIKKYVEKTYKNSCLSKKIPSNRLFKHH